MYTVSDVIDMGGARELVLAEIKCEPVTDDTEWMTTTCEELFDI